MSALYAVREGLSGFRRAKLAAAGSVLTITISLLLLGFFYVISSNISRIVGRIREQVEMEAFLDEPVTKQRTSEIQQSIAGIEGVDHILFVSKEDAAKIFKEEFGEDINAVLDFNPLPPSFKVFLKPEYRTSAHADEIDAKLAALKGIGKVVYRKEMLEFIEKQTRTLDVVGLLLGSLIAVSAIFLVSNTIRLTIYAKRKAIQTMKLVGASWWFVRAPFLVEGVMQGVVGGLLAAGIVHNLLKFVAGIVSMDLGELLTLNGVFFSLVVLAGAALGLLGSAISVRRFIGESVGS